MLQQVTSLDYSTNKLGCSFPNPAVQCHHALSDVQKSLRTIWELLPHSYVNHLQNTQDSKAHDRKWGGGTYKIKMLYLFETAQFYLAPGSHYALLLCADNSHLQSDNDFNVFLKWWQSNSLKDQFQRSPFFNILTSLRDHGVYAGTEWDWSSANQLWYPLCGTHT